MPEWVFRFVEEIGGGLPAVIIVAQFAAIAFLWVRNNRTTDARFDDLRRHTAELLDANRTLDRAVDALQRGRRDG